MKTGFTLKSYLPANFSFPWPTYNELGACNTAENVSWSVEHAVSFAVRTIIVVVSIEQGRLVPVL